VVLQVPALHMSDVQLSDPSKKFTIGKVIKCRVLTVDVGAKKVVLTAKKSLVTSTLPALSAYEQAAKGMIVNGYVTNAKDYGCTVEFYGGVHGLIPITDLQKSAGLDGHPSTAYKRGQTLKCAVVNVEPTKRKMTLSLNTTKKESGAGATSASGACPSALVLSHSSLLPFSSQPSHSRCPLVSL
jgi:rRNA biogenesis protein RRP5